MKKPITNLLITGITTCEQMKKLAKLTNTELNASVKDGTWRNDYGMVTYRYGMYLDYIKTPSYPAIVLTWEEFLAKYDTCAKIKKENKKLKKQLKKLQEPWSTDDLEDKQLVWYWDREECVRHLGFWSKTGLCTYDSEGKINKLKKWNSYKPYEGKIKPWMKRAKKALK